MGGNNDNNDDDDDDDSEEESFVVVMTALTTDLLESSKVVSKSRTNELMNDDDETKEDFFLRQLQCRVVAESSIVSFPKQPPSTNSFSNVVLTYYSVRSQKFWLAGDKKLACDKNYFA